MASSDELKELARQLRQPHGTKGLEIADMMHANNIGMTLHSIDCLRIQDGENILEIGHGNGGHLEYLLKQKKNLTYFGLEMSELMNKETQRINALFLDSGQAIFRLYDGQNIPFPDNSFDKIFTVNTIYFWANPGLFLSELYRVLKPGGTLNITFAQKSFMEQLPFTRFGFDLYDDAKMQRLIDTSAFRMIASEARTETVISKTGDPVQRDFVTVSLEK